MEKLMLQILREEVKPATGCTEPVAVALAAAEAKKYFELHTGETLNVETAKLTVGVSPNLFKNGLGVGIPNCKLRGLGVSAALGLLACNPEDKLKVFENMTADKVELATKFFKSNQVQLGVLDTADKVRVEVILTQGEHVLSLLLLGTHDHVEWVKVDHATVFSQEGVSGSAAVADKGPFYAMTIQEIVKTIETMDIEPFAFLKDGLIMNRKMATAGLETSMGMGVGYGISQGMKDGDFGNDLVSKAMVLTAGASDARMSGLNMTVMSSNGSGNNGLTAILPLAAYFESHQVSEEDQLRALAMSHLLNCYIKDQIGRLSAMCSCAISAAAGSGSAIAWLMTKDVHVVENTIQNMIGNLSGMICDGAKEGCAMKLATGAGTGVQAAILAKHGVIMPAHNGIVGVTAEESIHNLGTLSKEGMQLTDGVILDIMKSML